MSQNHKTPATMHAPYTLGVITKAEGVWKRTIGNTVLLGPPSTLCVGSHEYLCVDSNTGETSGPCAWMKASDVTPCARQDYQVQKRVYCCAEMSEGARCLMLPPHLLGQALEK